MPATNNSTENATKANELLHVVVREPLIKSWHHRKIHDEIASRTTTEKAR